MNRTSAVYLVILLLLISGCNTNSTPLIASSVDTTLFDGNYQLLEEESFLSLLRVFSEAENEVDRSAYEAIMVSSYDQFSNFTIDSGVIRSGSFITQEFSLIEAEIEGSRLLGSAYWHEDVRDPGDYVEMQIELRLTDDILHLWYFESTDEMGDEIVLVRIP